MGGLLWARAKRPGEVAARGVRGQGWRGCAVWVGAVLMPRVVWATPPINPDTLVVVAGLRTTRAGPLVTTLHEVEIDCRAGSGVAVCQARLRYRVQNPTAEAVTMGAWVPGEGAAGVTTRCGESLPTIPLQDAPSGHCRNVTVMPGAAVEVLAHVALRGNLVGSSWLAVPVGQARHPLLYRGRPAEGHAMNVRIDLGDARLPDQGVPVRVRVGSSWRFVGSSRGPRDWRTEGSAGDFRTTLTSASDNVVRFDLAQGLRLGHGGPWVGIGGAFADASGLRMRFGYELTGPFDAGVISVATDTDFDRHLNVAAVFEVGTPTIVFLPSVALGAGAVLRVLPTVAAGARLQGTIQFPVVGFVTAADLYPSQGGLPAAAEVTMMARFSL